MVNAEEGGNRRGRSRREGGSVFLYILFEAMDSSDSALQLLTQYPSAGSRVWSGVCTMAEGWQSELVEKAYYYLAD